jgi:G3E family GTPase
MNLFVFLNLEIKRNSPLKIMHINYNILFRTQAITGSSAHQHIGYLCQMEKIPVNIISGFLGSGKTTAIIKLLNGKENDEQWTVIINEFGKISIDSQTLRSSSQRGMVFEISGGCICCSAKGYFKENLEKILLEGNYSRIIIEPTGLGGIDMVSEIVNAIPGLQLRPVICLVDIAIIENPRLQLIPVYRTQISRSDIIAFSKCDLLTDVAEKDRLIGKFKSLFPDKQCCIDSSDFDQFASLIDNDFKAKVEKYKYRMVSSSPPNLSDINYQEMNYIYGEDTIFNTESLASFFKNHPSIIRAKGHIKTEKGWHLLNFTLSGCGFEPCQAKEFNEIILIIENRDPVSFPFLEALVPLSPVVKVDEI